MVKTTESMRKEVLFRSRRNIWNMSLKISVELPINWPQRCHNIYLLERNWSVVKVTVLVKLMEFRLLKTIRFSLVKKYLFDLYSLTLSMDFEGSGTASIHQISKTPISIFHWILMNLMRNRTWIDQIIPLSSIADTVTLVLKLLLLRKSDLLIELLQITRRGMWFLRPAKQKWWI